ncbi:unnamed protein product [Moneuplotes crassus]|uniref:Uncharacterized protein n=1 Tax=Euplotes crassus TaxID=5936 RepID=A0AAD1XZ81_EUPCR|nr:unnamed protein product [Moneuplotes crassus]
MNTRLLCLLKIRNVLLHRGQAAAYKRMITPCLVYGSKKIFSTSMGSPKGCDDAFIVYPENLDSLSAHFLEENEDKPCLCITKQCIFQVNKLKSQNQGYKYLKIEVDNGGCSGFQYNISMCDKITEKDILFTKDDVTLLVDEITLDMINGSTIHYKDEMIRSAFEVVSNPNASLNCSCGVSFSPKGSDIF